MRTWARHHPYAALAVGYIVFFLISTAIWLAFHDGNLADAAAGAGMNTLVYWLLAIFHIRNLRRTAARLRARGQVRVFIRYPDSRPGSLSAIWNQGIATPAAGLLEFQPAVYDNLEASGRPTTLRIHEVQPERRKVTGKDRKYLTGFGIRALTLLTDHGTVEVAANPESLDRLAETVR